MNPAPTFGTRSACCARLFAALPISLVGYQAGEVLLGWLFR